MSTKKKWLDLNNFGAKLLVVPKSEIRDQVAVIQIYDTKKLESTLKTSINEFLEKLRQTNNFEYIHNENDSKLNFMYKGENGQISIANIKTIFPIKNEDIKEIELDEIYLVNPMNDIQKNQWQTIFEKNRQQNPVLYALKQPKTFSPTLTLNTALKTFVRSDIGWNKIPTLMQSIDPLPLHDLDRYGYKPNSALVRYYVDKEAALNSGYKVEDIEPIELKNQLVIGVNSIGEVLAFKDITQIQELTNYNITDHDLWMTYNSLPAHFLEIRELNKIINTSIDSIVQNINSDSLDTKLDGLNRLQILTSKINECLYSIDENSIPSSVAPFGIDTYSLENIDDDWKVWSYNNQTLEVIEYDVEEKISDLIKSLNSNINILRSFDPYAITDQNYDAEYISESLDVIDKSILKLDIKAIKKRKNPDNKQPVKGQKLLTRIESFVVGRIFKPEIGSAILNDSIVRLALLRKVKEDYLHKIQKVKEERQTNKEVKAKFFIAERLQKNELEQAIKYETEIAYALDAQTLDEQSYELELSLSQLNIAYTRLNNIYDTFFDAIIDKELDGNELNNFLHSTITDQELAEELQSLLDEYNEFQAFTTSQNIDIYQIIPDIGEEPNYLWNDAVNSFDVIHYYDESYIDKINNATDDFEYSILENINLDQPKSIEANNSIFEGSISIIENDIEALIKSSAEKISKSQISFIEHYPKILSQLTKLNNKFATLELEGFDSATPTYLSSYNIERLNNLLDSSGTYKGFNKRIDVAHVLIEMSNKLNYAKGSLEEKEINELTKQLVMAINDEIRIRREPSNLLAESLVFVSNNSILNLKDKVSSEESYAIQKNVNYLPTIINVNESDKSNYTLISSMEKKSAVLQAYKMFIEDFYKSALRLNIIPDSIKENITSEHKQLINALNYMTPTHNEVLNVGVNEIDTAVLRVQDAVSTYTSQGGTLLVEEERNIRSLALFSTTNSSDVKFLRILPMDLGQKVLALQKQSGVLASGSNGFEHLLSSNPISQDKLNINSLRTTILNRLLVKEAVPRYEKSLNTELLLNYNYTATPRYLPTDVASGNIVKLGSILEDKKVLKNLSAVPDSIATIDSKAVIIEGALNRLFVNQGSEFWNKYLEATRSFNPAHLLNIIQHPDKIDEFVYPELDIYLTLKPASEYEHAAVGMYFNNQLIPEDEIRVTKFNLSDLTGGDKKLLSSFSFKDESDFNDQISELIRFFNQKQNVFDSFKVYENNLFNTKNIEYLNLTYRNLNGRYIDEQASERLINYLADKNPKNVFNLFDGINSFISNISNLQDSKLLLLNDKNELVIDVIDKDMPVIQSDTTKVFATVEQFATYCERGNLLKDFNLNSIKRDIFQNLVAELDIEKNILKAISYPLSPSFDDISINDLNEIVSANINTIVNKIDFSFGQKIIEGKDKFNIAVKTANESSPLQITIIHNDDNKKFIDEGYKIIQPTFNNLDQNYSLNNLAREIKNTNVFSSRAQVYLPSHINSNVNDQSINVDNAVKSDVEVVAPGNSTEDKRIIEDTGMKIPGAKKDLYGPRLSLSQIQDMSLLQVKTLLTKDKIWKKESVLQAKENDRDIYIHLLTDAVRKIVDEQPRYSLENSTEDQFKRIAANYYDAVISLRDALLDSKTLREFIPKASDLFIRMQEEQDLKLTYKGMSSNISTLIEGYARYEMAGLFLLKQHQDEPDKERREQIAKSYMKLSNELPPVRGTYTIYRKLRSAIDSKVFQSKLGDIDFKSSFVTDTDSLFRKVDADLSVKIMDALTTKNTKNQANANDADDFKDMTKANIMAHTSKEIDDLFKSYIKPRNLRKTLKINEVVITEDISSRQDEDITAHKLQATFGFKAIEFGEYLNQNDRQEALNYAYDGCFALAKALNVDSKTVGFNGMLGLAFGSRGKSAAMAHYEPANRVINLTKNSGFGSFGHEWFHAYDHIIFNSISRNNPSILLEVQQPFLSRAAQLHKVTDRKFREIDAELLSAAVSINEAMCYLPLSLNNSLEEIKNTLNNQVNYYKETVYKTLDKTLANHPDVYKIFSSEIPLLESNINTFINSRDSINTKLLGLSKWLNKFPDPKEFHKDAVEHRRYYDINNSMRKFLSEYEYPINKTEIHKYLSQANSTDELERVTAAKVIGALDSTVFKTVLFRDHRQLIRSQFAVSALEFLEKNLSDDLTEDHAKLIALSLVTTDRYEKMETAIETEFYKNAKFLDSLTSSKKSYWPTAHEMFARSGEQYLQVVLAEMNLRNDWLVYPCPENSSLAITQPHGVEKDNIIREIRDYTVKGLEYIQENIAELRFSDHKQYVRHALHYFQTGTDQHENLLKWKEKLDAMSQTEYDAYWNKLMSNIESKAESDLKTQHSYQNELSI
ncbi:TPA: hypothetical protein MW242_001884 [Acinetobacter baumannii]|nr:hypothetical protein [Acinetobacter baumannii]